jgi:hypothetical protein
MGDVSQRGGRVARVVDDLRSRGERALARQLRPEPTAPAAEAPDPAPPDKSILRRLEAVEHALEELVRELRAASRAPTEPDEPGPQAAESQAAGGREIELDDPFGLLAREPGSPKANGNGR